VSNRSAPPCGSITAARGARRRGRTRGAPADPDRRSSAHRQCRNSGNCEGSWKVPSSSKEETAPAMT
jgi:hypothetical protein